MANHDIPYTGYSTLGDTDADRSDTVRVKNESSVTVTVSWPSGCFDPAPPASEDVDPNAYSGTYTIGQSAQVGQDYPVKIEPTAPSKLPIIDEPETAVPNIHILG